MSLEQELARNTEAMIALTAALSKTAIFPVIETTTEVKEVETPKPLAATPPEVLLTPSEPAATPDTPAVTAIEYADVAAAIVATAKKDKLRVIQTLANFGASRGPQLKSKDFEAFLKELSS